VSADLPENWALNVTLIFIFGWPVALLFCL
jgi:hypothetical protein